MKLKELFGVIVGWKAEAFLYNVMVKEYIQQISKCG